MEVKIRKRNKQMDKHCDINNISILVRIYIKLRVHVKLLNIGSKITWVRPVQRRAIKVCLPSGLDF